jgi:hypothetical protein
VQLQTAPAYCSWASGKPHTAHSQALPATRQPPAVFQTPRVSARKTLKSQAAGLQAQRSRVLWLQDLPALPAASAPAPRGAAINGRAACAPAAAVAAGGEPAVAAAVDGELAVAVAAAGAVAPGRMALYTNGSTTQTSPAHSLQHVQKQPEQYCECCSPQDTRQISDFVWPGDASGWRQSVTAPVSGVQQP